MAPDFLEDFASSFLRKKENFKERMLKGKPNMLDSDFRQLFSSIWIPLEKLDEYVADAGSLEITAVDSSIYSNPMSTGGIFYVIRALATCKERERRILETDVFFTKASLLESQRFLGRKMEMLEFQVAIDAIKNGLSCSVILIDGSLCGRASAFPVETKIEDERLTLLNYFQSYRELLDLCKQKEITLIGVSKESRSTFYRDYLLSLIFSEELNELEKEIDPADVNRLKPLLRETIIKSEQTIIKFDKLRQRYDHKLDRVGIILDELRSSRPDYQLLMTYASTSGYAKPMLLGPSENLSRMLQQCLRNPRKYIRTHFPISTREKGEDFIDWASNVLSGFKDFPAFVSTYYLLDPRDSPMRVDLPFWDRPFVRAGWPKPLEFSVEKVLQVLITGYCGLDCYNLWLKNVDERVRLKKRTVDTIYFPLMEKQFGAKIIRGRSYRRVKYT
ncbi:DNA double-strand break repair nuclease NurA [Candidatus Bathyarchaeota archaeon]|nr:DNA double-strand break repair nuclease NurA [Candidatus Bathyarchaeota archaeon]